MFGGSIIFKYISTGELREVKYQDIYSGGSIIFMYISRKVYRTCREVKYQDVAPANLTTTFETVCSLSPPVKDEDSPQRHCAQ